MTDPQIILMWIGGWAAIGIIGSLLVVVCMELEMMQSVKIDVTLGGILLAALGGPFVGVFGLIAGAALVFEHLIPYLFSLLVDYIDRICTWKFDIFSVRLFSISLKRK